MIFGRDPHEFLAREGDDHVINVAMLRRAIELYGERLREQADYMAFKVAELLAQVL